MINMHHEKVKVLIVLPTGLLSRIISKQSIRVLHNHIIFFPLYKGFGFLVSILDSSEIGSLVLGKKAKVWKIYTEEQMPINMLSEKHTTDLTLL